MGALSISPLFAPWRGETILHLDTNLFETITDIIIGEALINVTAIAADVVRSRLMSVSGYRGAFFTPYNTPTAQVPVNNQEDFANPEEQNGSNGMNTHPV